MSKSAWLFHAQHAAGGSDEKISERRIHVADDGRNAGRSCIVERAYGHDGAWRAFRKTGSHNPERVPAARTPSTAGATDLNDDSRGRATSYAWGIVQCRADITKGEQYA